MRVPETTTLIAPLRAVARSIRHTPDRVLHPLRRRSALQRLQRAGLPRSVLFICHGNICRSPYAEHAFLRLLPRELREFMAVASAGFTGPGRCSPSNAIAVAADHGIDLQEHRARALNQEIVSTADLLVVMDTVQRDKLRLWYQADLRRVLVLGDLDPDPIDMRTVRDPILQPREVFAETYRRIDRCIVEMLRAITDGAAPAPVASPAGSAADAAEPDRPEPTAPEGPPARAARALPTA